MAQDGSGADVAAFTESVRAAFPSSGPADQSPPGWCGAYWESRSRNRPWDKSASWRERAARPEGAPSAAPNLDRSTLSDKRVSALEGLELDQGLSPNGQGWSVAVLEFPGRIFQVRACRVTEGGLRPDRERKRNGDAGEEGSRTDWQRAESAARRSRQVMTRRVLCLGADHLLTLTKRGKFETVDEAWKAFEIFSRYCRRFYRKGRWEFVAVPEQHKDGSYHMHVALRGFYHVGLLRRFWYRALGGKGNEQGSETPGSVNIQSFSRVRRGSARIARYVAKYMGKGFSSLDRGRRAYSCSAGLHPRGVTRWSEPLYLGSSDAAASIQRRLSDALGVPNWSSWFWAYAGRTGFILNSA